MKNSALNYVWFTTVFLVVYTILFRIEIKYPILFSLFILLHILLLRMVYKVLKDAFKSKKIFPDWYDDFPKKTTYDE